MVPTVRLLLVSGSLRSGSTNTALLRTAVGEAPEGIEAVLYEHLGELPHFDPDDDHEPLHPAVAGLRAELARTDAVLFSTPEYAGALPGSFKNLLDWTVGGGQTYGMPVAYVNASATPTGASDAHQSLRTVLRVTGAELVEAACAHIPVERHQLAADGTVDDPEVRHQLVAVLTVLAAAILARRELARPEQSEQP